MDIGSVSSEVWNGMGLFPPLLPLGLLPPLSAVAIKKELDINGEGRIIYMNVIL